MHEVTLKKHARVYGRQTIYTCLISIIAATLIPHSATAGSGSPSPAAQPALYTELMKAPHLPISQLSEYVRPVPVNNPKLLTRKPLHGNADLYSQHDNRHTLKHLLQYFINDKEDLSSQLTVEQATVYLQQQAGNGYPEAQDLLEQLGAPEDILTTKTATDKARTSTYDALLSLPILGSATKAFAKRSERLQVKKLMSSAGSIKLPAVVTPQIGIPAPDETVTKEDLRQDLKDKRELKEVLRTAGSTSTLTKVALGVLGVHALAQTAKAVSAPPPPLTMSPIQPYEDHSYFEGVVNIPNCPDGTCPGTLSLSRPVSSSGSSAPLCQIDTSQCVGKVCETSPECGLAAMTTPKPDGSSQVKYAVAPEAPGSFKMQYDSKDGLATARYDLPASVREKRALEKRATVTCRNLAISDDGVAYIPRVSPIYTTDWFTAKYSYSTAAVRVTDTECDPVLQVRIRPKRSLGGFYPSETSYWRENNAEVVTCSAGSGGGNGLRIPHGKRHADEDSGSAPFNISSDFRCIAPDNVAYDCPHSRAIAPASNTPANLFFLTSIPAGRWNTGLSGNNPKVVIANNYGKYARWGGYVSRLKSVYPNARCDGQNNGQPNAAFLTSTNLNDVFNQETNQNPGLDCTTANSFSVSPNTPANPHLFSIIPYGQTNRGLTGTNPNALVTKGYGKFIRWGDYVDRFKTTYYPKARCTGQLQGQPNAEFLTWTDLNNAFNHIADTQPGLACQASNAFTPSPNTPVNPLNINSIPVGGINQALSNMNPDALITNGQGQFVRWGDLQTSVRSLFPNARCTGALASQPNAEFLQTANLETAFNTVHAKKPGLACPAANAFTASPNTPANPLSLSNIPLGNLNQALINGTHPDAVVTNGQGQFVRWGDFFNYLKPNVPNARCDGELAGEPNAEFLQTTDLETAFNTAHAAQPGLACPAADAFTVSPNTPANPLNLTDISLGGFNHALNGTDPDALVTNGQGQFVRWGDLQTSIKNLFPSALCTGGLANQPNAEFLQTTDLETAFNTTHTAQPGLACPAADAFTVSPNTPANPLNIANITLGGFNHALNQTNPEALVTNGQGQFVRWEDLLNYLKTNVPNARCDGELAGQPNAEFLQTGDLEAAFNAAHTAQPGLACKSADAFTVSPNTPANPLNLTNISLGGFNQALSQTNPETLIINGQGQFVRWGDLLNHIKTNAPNARCDGELAGQPNAEFLLLTDLETAFNAAHTAQPGLACKSADAFTVPPNTPANPLNLTDISLGGFNQALSQTNPEALVTNGQGQFVRWGDLLNHLKPNAPNARCDGDLAGQPNAEFLTLTDLNNAFSQVAATQPGLACAEADNFTPSLNTPDNPLNMANISLGGFNQALGQANSQTIVTNGQGQFVRWGDLVNALKRNTPYARCEGDSAGQPNTEFLTMGDLNKAFTQEASAHPAFECSAANSFTPLLNTPADPLNVTDIPLGGFNQALGQTNPEALLTNGQGQLVRWGDLLNAIKATHPNARCDDPLAGQPNAEFLTWGDLNSAFSQAASTQPAIDCSTGNSFLVQPNTPADPLNINDIPLGGFNQALSQSNSRALVTNGQGQFVRWGDFLNRFKTFTHKARCEGPLAGQPNAEFLTWGDLNSAFDQVASTQPGLECTAANAFTPPESPADPLNINNIPLGGFNQALSNTSTHALVTNGQGQFARWGDLVNALKTINPNAHCDGPLAGQPNAEFLQTSDLDTAFYQSTINHY